MSDTNFTKDNLKVIDNGYYLDIHNVDSEEEYVNQACIGVPYNASRYAHLFATAPEMYAMLERFLPCDDDGNGDFIYNEDSEEMGEEVIKLLAKARGEL